MSQCDAILQHLKAGRLVDGMTALHKFGCFRLAARILELRQRGHKIQSKRITTRTGRHVALYWLA